MVGSRLPIVSSQIRPILWSAVSRYGLQNRPVLSHPNNDDQQEITEKTEMKAASNVNSSPVGFSHGMGTAPRSEALSHPFQALFSLFAPVQFRSSGLFFIVLALFAGCTVGPNYKRPQATTIPPAYTGATNVVATDSGATNGWKVAQPQAQFPKGDWWQIFGDADLNELERQASVANQQLKVAVARLAEARAQMDVTRAGLFPNISLSGSYTRQRTSPNTPATATGGAISGATFNDFFVARSRGDDGDLWGRVRRSVASSRTVARVSADDLRPTH